MLGDYALPLLLYAYDLAILSHSEEGVQHSINDLQAFCHRNRMTLNIEKGKARVFSCTETGLAVTYQLEGQQIEQLQDFRYLGLNPHQSKGFTSCTIPLTSRSSERPLLA